MMAKHYIRKWRKERGLTQKQLAERMEVQPGEMLMSYVTVSNIERDTQSPTLDQLEAFANALDVTVSDLVRNNPAISSEIIDLLERLDDANRPTVMAMLRAAVGI